MHNYQLMIVNQQLCDCALLETYYPLLEISLEERYVNKYFRAISSQ